MAEQFGDKQHEATPHRRQQAREQGQVAKSQDLTSALTLLAAVGLLLWQREPLAAAFARLTRQQLDAAAWLQADQDFAVGVLRGALYDLGVALLPLLSLMLLWAIVVNVGQSGFLWLPDKLALDFDRVNPWNGVQRLFSSSSIVKLVLGLFKMAFVAAVAAWGLWSERDRILGLSALDVFHMTTFIVEITLWTCLKVGAALLLLAALDYGFQWWKQEQELRMTTQEIREEMKTLQGDPQVMARRKAVQRKLVMQRMATAVPKADVVVTNPTELAIAIQYDHDQMDAPVVVAKGAGHVALRIRRLALEHGVPIVERKELARALYKAVDIGKPIPPEQYAAMAEVLRYVYQLQGKSIAGMATDRRAA